MAQNTKNAAAIAEEREAIIRHVDEYMAKIKFQTDEEILAGIVAASKAPNSESDKMMLEKEVCTSDEEFESIWPQAEHAAPSDQQQVDLLDQHRKTGFVLEKELGCVLLGTYLGPFGPTLRSCDSGLHECRHLKTSEFGDGGQIVIREPFYSVEHI
jgi:hypothetical protein